MLLPSSSIFFILLHPFWLLITQISIFFYFSISCLQSTCISLIMSSRKDPYKPPDTRNWSRPLAPAHSKSVYYSLKCCRFDQNPKVIYIHATAIVTLRNIHIFDVFSLIVNGTHSAAVIDDIVKVIYTCATVIDETSAVIRF